MVGKVFLERKFDMKLGRLRDKIYFLYLSCIVSAVEVSDFINWFVLILKSNLFRSLYVFSYYSREWLLAMAHWGLDIWAKDLLHFLKMLSLMSGRTLNNRLEGYFWLFRSCILASLEGSFPNLRFTSSFHIGRISKPFFFIKFLFIAGVGSRLETAVTGGDMLVETEAVDFFVFKTKKAHKIVNKYNSLSPNQIISFYSIQLNFFATIFPSPILYQGLFLWQTEILFVQISAKKLKLKINGGILSLVFQSEKLRRSITSLKKILKLIFFASAIVIFISKFGCIAVLELEMEQNIKLGTN